MSLVFRAGGSTQIGPHSPRQPVDYFLLDPRLGLFAVFDAGGSWSELRGQSGRTAAGAIQRVVAEFPVDAGPQAIISAAFRTADAALRAETDENGWHGGVSVALALVRGDAAFISWLGDTAAYRVTKDRVEPLTYPYTVWDEFLRRGTTQEADATLTPGLRNVLLYSLGGPLPDPLQVISFAPLPGDRLILTTDGVANHIPESTIFNACRAIPDPTTCAEAIVEHAVMAGSRDSCTCAVIVFGKEELS